MKIAVSGADGFLGSHILESLRNESDHDVAGITLFPGELANRFEGWDKLILVAADLATMPESDVLNDVDVFIACAFPRATGAEGLAQGLDFVYGSLGLLLDKGCKAVINVSSQSVYDPHRSAPAKETDEVLLTSTYAATKYCVELSVARMCQDKGVPYTNVRMASLIGPGFDQRFPNKMVKAAIETGVITVADNGSKFSFMDVRDACSGFWALLKLNPKLWPGIINLGCSASYTTQQVAEYTADVASSLSFNADVVSTPFENMRSPRNSEMDITSFSGLCDWIPVFTVEDSIKSIFLDIIGGA